MNKRMVKYNHTQTGGILFYVIFIIVILFGFIYYQSNQIQIVFFMIFIIIVLLSFISLNVTVDNEYLRIKFGYGLIRKKFILRNIEKVEIVKNKWYYGYGIRFWADMLIFNVSGLDAIQITMKNKKKYRIGTDEPIKLKNALINS